MNSQNFLCIRGYMKSGTNWLCRILNCHPDINCVGEFHWEEFFYSLDENVSRIAAKRKQWLDELVRPELHEFVKRCLIKIAGQSVSWIGDRTPTTISPIVLPEAKHFVMLRDFRDVIVSRMFHLYNHPQNTGVFSKFPALRERLNCFQKDPWYFGEHPEQLVDNQEIVRDSAKEWKAFIASDKTTISRHPETSVLIVKYENLHSNFDDTAKLLFQFLELETPELPERVRPGLNQENPTGLNRKGQVGDWQNYLSQECKHWINEEIFNELHELGYLESPDW